MLYIKLFISRIDGSEEKYDDYTFNNPNDFISMHSDALSQVEETSYYKSPENTLFPYLDELERSIAKSSHHTWWDWSGVRIGDNYHIKIDVITFMDSSFKFNRAFWSSFSCQLEKTDCFELPSINAPFVFDNTLAWVEDETDEYLDYDEDERLRILEASTAGNQYIQWTRSYPENNGAADLFSIIGAGAGIASFVYTFINDYEKYKKQQYYSKRIQKLLSIIVRKYNNQGRYILPAPKAPTIYNAESDEYEYVFTQIMDDGSHYRVYISSDGRYITRIPDK